MKSRPIFILLLVTAIVFMMPGAVFADGNGRSSVKVDFTSQRGGQFLHAPQFDHEVSASLAEDYGYTDTVNGVSCLDVLVAAHKLVLGDDFTPETANDYLQISEFGNATMMFGKNDVWPAFVLNRALPNDGTPPSEESGYYHQTLVANTEARDGDLVEFFFRENEMGETYNWFKDSDGAYSRELTVKAGRPMYVYLKGINYGELGMFNDFEEIVNSPYGLPQDGVQIYTVNLETGALTPMEGAVTGTYGGVSLQFAEPGTYAITAYADEEEGNTQIMSLTTIRVMENSENEILRLYGQSRFDTSIAAAEHLKEKKQITKFDNMIIASGLDFPDALSSTYLAYVKEAPILLVGKDAASIKKITDYANENLNEGGMVYLVGGKSAVSLDVENALTGTVKRLSGKDRYKTNMAVLDEAGVAGEELLVACGTNYADALSASAAGRPIFLVGASLTDEQMEYLTTNRYEWGGKVYVIGGKGAVSEEVEADVARCVGATRRLFGSDRYLTSKVVAMEFFRGSLDNMVIASGKGFPDGLSGGPVACAYDAPLLLVADGHFDHATELFQERGADRLIVMGGKSVISRDVAEAIAAPVTETD